MADETKNNAQETEKKGTPFLVKALIVATLAILVVVISTATAFFVATKISSKSNSQQEMVQKDNTVDSVEKIEYGQTSYFGDYTVNLNEDNPRYLVVSIYFEYSPKIKAKELEKIQADVETNKVILQDRVISILMSKSIADLKADKDFIKLREMIKDEVNKVLGKEYLINIRFSNVLIQ
ncbi:MAG: Flagellar basal body-associated protein FliL [Fusobacteriaceae bacterium]|jgi:flagellar basal body-associated protein FliL|nr:hypothetical protein [Fusobacteriales bacterium]MDN5303740.1 Flagellar basal body-associated protein FliL [Fusobacteriaceae bacterium]